MLVLVAGCKATSRGTHRPDPAENAGGSSVAQVRRLCPLEARAPRPSFASAPSLNQWSSARDLATFAADLPHAYEAIDGEAEMLVVLDYV